MKKIVITGAGGQIAYSLIFRIAAGELLGSKNKFILSLLEAPLGLKALEGVRMEIEDGCFDTVAGLHITCDPEESFRDADLLFLIGAKPRTQGMQRNDLLKENAPIFSEQGEALKVAKKEAIVLVVGNPCNTNGWILAKKAEAFDKRRIFSMSKLDELRARALIAKKAGVPTHEVHSVAIWGNHSNTLVVDYEEVKLQKRLLIEQISDRNWLENTLQEEVRNRGSKVIEIRGKSSAASAAHAALSSMKDLLYPTEDLFSIGCYTQNNPYGLDPDLFFSLPCISKGDGLVIPIPKKSISPFLRQALQITEKELIQERELASTSL